MKRWLIVLAASVALVCIGFALWLMLRPPGETVKAEDFIAAVQRDPNAAKEKYLYQWVRVQGVVRDCIEVEGDDGPFVMIDLETKGKPDVQASFNGKEIPAPNGETVIVEGYCALCEPGTVYLERCRILSRGKDAKDTK